MDADFYTSFLLLESLVTLRWAEFSDLLSHMFMPALALAIPLAAIIAQLLKQSLKETMHLDYITLARTRGIVKFTSSFEKPCRMPYYQLWRL